MNPLDGNPAWFVAELQSRWAQSIKAFEAIFEIKESDGEFTVVNKDTNRIHTGIDIDGSKWTTKEEAKSFIKEVINGRIANHPLLATHQKAVLNAVIAEAKKEGIETIIVSDAETAMMTEQHDRNLVIPNGTYVLPSGETFIIGDGYTNYYRADENPEQTLGKQIQSYNKEYAILKEAAGKGEVPYVVKQEKGMRVAYDVTIPSLAKEVTGKVGIPVNLGEHKNKQSVYSYEGDYKGEGSIYFKNPDGSPKSDVTGKAYDITGTGPKAAMLFADVLGVQLVTASVKTAFQVAKDLATFTARITKELGEWIKPYAQKLWDTMRTSPATIEEVVKQIAAEAAPKQTGRLSASAFNALAAELPKSHPIRTMASKIHWQYLPYTERQKLSDLAKDYFAAKKGKGPVVKTSVFFDAIKKAAEDSYNRAFVKSKQAFPLSLKGKNASEFTSLKDIRGYVAKQDNAEGEKIRTRIKARSDQGKAVYAKKKSAAVQNFESAIAELNTGIIEKVIADLSPEQQADVLKAIEYITNIDPKELAQSELEHITAAVQNLTEDSLVGIGPFLSTYRKTEFRTYGLKAKEMTGAGLSVPLDPVTDTLSSSPTAQKLARHDVRERMTFLAPVWKQLWERFFAAYGSDGMAIFDQLKLGHTAALEAVIKKHGFSQSILKTWGRHTETLSAKRMGIVSLLSQFRDVDPIGDLNKQLRNTIKGIQAMQNDKSSLYQGIGQVEGTLLADFLRKGLQKGYLAQDETEGATIVTTPEEWTAFLVGELTPKEKGALADIWKLTQQYTKDLKFVQEFVYGREWEPWNNYIMQQAMTLNGNEVNAKDGIELDESTLANDDFLTPVGKTQSILNPRMGLNNGQFYNLNIFHTAISGMNQAAYEIGTAQPRMDIKAIMEDPQNTSLWGSEADKKQTYKIYKDMHQKALGIETGTMPEGTPRQQIAAYMFMRPLQVWTSHIMNSFTNLGAQYISPVSAYGLGDTRSGPILIDTMLHVWGSKEWTREKRRAFIKQALPALLTRIETYDPAYDDMVGSGLVEEIRRIAKDNSFVPLTPQQKRLKNLGRSLNISEALAAPAIAISRFNNVNSDALAAEQIFLAEYAKYLLDNKIINNISEFSPDIFNKDAARQADRTVTEVLGGAGSREKRPNAFSFTPSRPFGRLGIIALRGMFLHLAGIRTQMASDTMRSVGEMFYNNPKDTQGSEQVRSEAMLRIRRNVIQNATFIATKYALGALIAKTLIFGAGFLFPGLDDLEGLDEEEKEMLRRIEAARIEAQKGAVGITRAIQDIGLMVLGPYATNEIGSFAADKTMSIIFDQFFKDDLKNSIADLEKRRDKETNILKKKNIQDELDIANNIMSQYTFLSQSNIDHGQMSAVRDFSEFMLRNKTVSNAEADRIAMDYYEKTKGKLGAMKESPDKTTFNKATRLGVDWFLRAASTDIGTAQTRINKVRTVVATKRKQALERTEKGVVKPETNPKPIDSVFGPLR